MPQHLRDAVIAVEDARFYEHDGFDVRGTIRAAWSDLVAQETVQGGSTITQQLVKRVYAGRYIEGENGVTDYVVPPRTVKEKVREVLLAVKVERTLSKDQILSRYLNTVYFGHGAYGIEAAAQTYFGIPARRSGRCSPRPSRGSSRPPRPTTRSTIRSTRSSVGTSRSIGWCSTATSTPRARSG